MHANHSQQLDHVEAGDIAVMIGLKGSQTGDTLGVEAFPILLEKMHFPEPGHLGGHRAEDPLGAEEARRRCSRCWPSRTRPSP